MISMQIRKTVSFLITFVMMLALVPITSASSIPLLDLVHSSDIPIDEILEDPEYGRIKPMYANDTGKFSYFDFYVTATKATTGTRYRSPEMWIKVGEYPAFTFDTSNLANWQPSEGSAGQAVRLNAEDLYSCIIEQIPSINCEEEAATTMFSHDKISVGFKIEVYDLSTGKVLGSAATQSSAASLLASHGFGSNHIEDVKKQFQDLPLLSSALTPATFKLTVLKSGEGKIVPPEGEHFYPAGQEVNITATPSKGWKFVRWEGSVSGTSPSVQVIMDSDKTVKAVFEKIKHTLTIHANPNIGGSTNPTPGKHIYEYGETVNLSASAYEGWRFVCWGANASGTNPSTSILMDRDKVVTANFEKDSSADIGPGDPAGMGETILLPHGKRKTE